MNTKNNQRYRETENTIRAAVDELLNENRPEELSVREICRRAGVNRSTFYLHFQDVYDMMDKFEAALSEEMIAAFSREGTRNIGEGFVNNFAFIAEHANFYRAWLNSPHRKRAFPFVLPRENEAQIKQLRTEIGLVSDAEFEYQQGFFMGGVAEVVRMWLEGGCKESPEELCDMMLGVFHHGGGPWSDWA